MLDATYAQEERKTRLLLAAATLLGECTFDAQAIEWAVLVAINLEKKIAEHTGLN